jgi:epsilon-lactone hydrolase
MYKESGATSLKGESTMASEQNRKVIELIKSRPADPDASIERRRRGMEKISEHVASDVVCTPVDVAGIRGEWVAAPGAASDRAILYLHGGGYVTGSIVTHRAMVARISRASGARVLIIDYRLAPENPFPAALEDAVTAYNWMLAQGLRPGRIAVAGDSAGGGLALATLLKNRCERGPPPIRWSRLATSPIRLSPITESTIQRIR